MSQPLTLDKFRWIVTDKEKDYGYYSLTFDEWELAVDWEYDCWTVYVCNNCQEVLEEYGCATKDEAIEIANRIYCCFKPSLSE